MNSSYSLMLRSFPENPQFRPNILGQQASINHKIASHRVTSVTQSLHPKGAAL